MYETDKSTPSSYKNEDTFSNSSFADTPDFSEPDEPFEEPENLNEEADVTDEESDNNELIFGKFKTMEEAQKSYKEAERAITKAALLEKELQQYQAQSEKYEQESIARSKGFSDRLEMALEHDARQHELDNYAVAATHVLPPQLHLEVAELIQTCRTSGKNADLSKLRRYFTPEVVALAAEDLALYRNARQAEYNQIRDQDRKIRFERKLDEFERIYGNWADSPAKVGLISQALQITDGQANLAEVKEMIDAIEADAVRKYHKKKAVVQENSAAQDSLTVPGTEVSRNKSKKWLTKDEYYKLTPEQEADKYDLIVEQVKLEKKGLLPRMLTNL